MKNTAFKSRVSFARDGLDSKFRQGPAWRFLICVVITGSMALPAATAAAGKLGVYSLWQYENNWKQNIHLDTWCDPYYTFFNLMTMQWPQNMGYLPADPQNSQRLFNQQVTLDSVLPLPTSTFKTWDDFDLVFFFGHNNTVTPPYPHNDGWKVFNSPFDPNSNDHYHFCPGTPNSVFEDEVGTPNSPFDYYAIRHITDGLAHPGALTYLYNEYTSSLLGSCYDYSVACNQEVGTGSYYRQHCYDFLQFANYPQLGDRNLKWLILDGCQAVITANAADGSYNNTALRALPYTHGQWHIVLGHYIPWSPGQAKDLSHFAYSLMQNVPIQPAYFDTDPDRNSSAIAAENAPCADCILAQIMSGDRWGSPMPAAPTLTRYYSQRWIRTWTQINIVLLPPPGPPPPPGTCTYALTPTQQFFDSGFSTGMVNLATSPTCSWTVLSSNSWIVVTSPTSGSGSASIGYQVSANTDASARSGSLVIADQAFTITQWSTYCPYSLDASQRLHGPGAEAGTVAVTANAGCPWTVNNSNTWLVITSATNNAGSGVVSYSVAANLSPAARTGVVAIASQPFTVIQAADPLTMDTLPIDSPEARALLGMDALPFRQIQTNYRPTNPVPVLNLETINDTLCRQRLNQAVGLGFFPASSILQGAQAGNLLTAKSDASASVQSVAWVNRTSGAFSFVRVQNSMSVPTTFTNFQEAIQLALAYVGTQRLIEPVPDEQVDLLYVSTVENAFSTLDAPASPLQQFRSDHYVAFGRRFRGVPIVGSELVLRLDGNRQVAMVRKNWRRITQVSSELAIPSTNTLGTLLTRDARFYPNYSSSTVDPAEIAIIDMQCGYLEAPQNFPQTQLRLGGNLKFAIGATNSQEDFPQMTLPLEDGRDLQSFWGREYQPSLLTVQSYRADGCTLVITSSGGYNYDIQGSTNLSDWVQLGTVSNVTSAATFVDPQAAGLQQRYYRAVQLP